MSLVTQTNTHTLYPASEIPCHPLSHFYLLRNQVKCLEESEAKLKDKKKALKAESSKSVKLVKSGVGRVKKMNQPLLNGTQMHISFYLTTHTSSTLSSHTHTHTTSTHSYAL